MSDYMAGTQHRLRRGRTSDLWAPLNPEAMRSNPELGFFRDFDFVHSIDDISAWALTSATAGTGTFASVDSHAGSIGVARITAAATAHYGPVLQLGQAAGASFTPTANSVYAIEVCGLLTASTLPRLFMGLATKATSPFGATGALDTSANAVGLSATSAIGALQTSFRKASGTAVHGTAFHTMETAKSYKLGMRLTGTNLLEVWMNGIKIRAATVDSAVMPLVIMQPTLTVINGGASASIFDVDLISVGWNYSADLTYAAGT